MNNSPSKQFIHKIQLLESGQSETAILSKYDALFIIEIFLKNKDIKFEVEFSHVDKFSKMAEYKITATKN